MAGQGLHRASARRVAAAIGLCVGLLAPVPAAVEAAGPGSAASMYSPDAIVAIDLTLPQASLEALEKEPKSDAYVEGTFAAAGTDGTPAGIGEFTAPQKVEVRLKGGLGSFRELSEKAAFKLKFPKSGLFLGLRRMTLNNMVQDPSMVHERLAYELFHALGVPASRTGYAFLRINGQPYGVYLNIETLDGTSLPSWFDSTLHLYEADAPGTDLTPGDAEKFEVDEGDDEDVSDLEALIVAANDTDGDWSDGMAAVADLAEMTTMWAGERYAGHWDGYAGLAGLFRPNNYYLHSLDSGVFQMMPWGADQTWEDPVAFDDPAGGVLFNSCLADESCAALYEEGLAEVAATVPGLEFDVRTICTAGLLAPWQNLEDPKRREFDAQEIAQGVADTHAFVALRPAELAEFLAAEPPDAPVEDPCPGGEEPQPPTPQPPTVFSAAAGPPRPLLRVGPVSIDGRWLKVRATVSGPGRLRIAAETLGPAGARVCGAGKEVDAARSVRLSCRLSIAAQQARRLQALKARFRVSFRTATGLLESTSRTIDLPRL